METLMSIEFKTKIPADEIHYTHISGAVSSSIKNGLTAKIISLKNVISFVKTAFCYLKSVKKSMNALRQLIMLQKSVWGNRPKKWVHANGKNFFNLYAAGFPSAQLKRMHLMELKRMNQSVQNTDLRFVFLAITKKCPLMCQHCFEWDKLHAKELLSYDDLRNTVIKLKEMGIVQLHLSGGEPMIRVKEIAKLAAEFHNHIDFYVLTSGFNCTLENIIVLKKTGITGLTVSLDHYDKNLHNAFRGSVNAYDDALNAVRYARSLDMVVTLSICVTRAMATMDHLLTYAKLAKSLDVSFIQLLEPRQVGNFAGKDVLLNQEQLALLSDFYEMLNFTKQYKEYPIIVFHGYYQRKIGCFSAGNRSLYIDTNGDILLCPFCHHKSGNVLTDHLPSVIPVMRDLGCPSFGNAMI